MEDHNSNIIHHGITHNPSNHNTLEQPTDFVFRILNQSEYEKHAQ